jgi:hypothetical protein
VCCKLYFIIIPYLVQNNKLPLFRLHNDERRGNLFQFIAQSVLETHFSRSLSSVKGSERIHNGVSRDKFCSIGVQNLREVLDLDLSLRLWSFAAAELWCVRMRACLMNGTTGSGTRNTAWHVSSGTRNTAWLTEATKKQIFCGSTVSHMNCVGGANVTAVQHDTASLHKPTIYLCCILILPISPSSLKFNADQRDTNRSVQSSDRKHTVWCFTWWWKHNSPSKLCGIKMQRREEILKQMCPGTKSCCSVECVGSTNSLCAGSTNCYCVGSTLTVSAGIQIRYFIWQQSVAGSYRTGNLINVANAPSICTSGGSEAVDNTRYFVDTKINRAACLLVLFLRVTSRHICMYVYLSDGSVQVVQSVRTKGSVTQSWGCILSHSGGSIGNGGGNLWTHTHTHTM